MAPRVFIARHGETEWSLNGRHTGTTDLALTANGKKRMQKTGEAMVYCSPRKRAMQTLELLGLPKQVPAEVMDSLSEWDYGKYEGLKTAEIKQRAGEDWDMWKDGCEGGESPEQVTQRVDKLIAHIQAMQKDHMTDGKPGDVLLVCHAHIGRSIAIRWIGQTLQEGPHLILEAGGIGVLSYEHNSPDEPALMLGGAFMSNLS